MQSSLISDSTYSWRRKAVSSSPRFQCQFILFPFQTSQIFHNFSSPRFLEKSPPWPTSWYTNRRSSFLPFFLVHIDKYASSIYMYIYVQTHISMDVHKSTCSLKPAVNSLTLIHSHEQYPGWLQQWSSFRCWNGILTPHWALSPTVAWTHLLKEGPLGHR